MIMQRRWRFFNLAASIALATCAMAPMRASGPIAPATTPVQTRQAASANGRANGVLAPTAQNSVRFAVLGDTGTGERAQYDIGAVLANSYAVFPYEFVIMMGDNLYGSERPQDYARKFETPYKAIIDRKIPFYAALGNHDDPNQRFYKFFNMNGERYYTFKKGSVRFFVLDSNYMSRDQLEWVDRELAISDSPWKIAYFHHPLYSSGGRHGAEVDLRQQLEPLFLKHGIRVVFQGHEHFYERLKPQKGIHYFTAGGSAKLRAGDIQRTALTDFGFDSDYSFMLVEIAGDVMNFQTLSRSGRRIDAGAITRPNQSLTDKP